MASPVQAGLTMGSVQDRLAERLGQEERLLAEAFPTARLDRESLTVLLPDLPLTGRLVSRPQRRALRHS